jgi:hypothetical protein
MVIDGLAEHRPPGLASDDMDSDAYGELRARQGVTFSELLTGWRFGGDALYRLARELAPDTPTRDTILLEFIELTMRWVNLRRWRWPAVTVAVNDPRPRAAARPDQPRAPDHRWHR